jgi:hypothetical protein
MTKTIKIKEWNEIPSDYTGIVEWPDGSKAWFLNGRCHRKDGPAIEWADGDKSWYLNGKWHREDGPAIEHTSGHKEWWLNGTYHREDGPAIEWADGDKQWWLNDKLLFRLSRESQPFVFLEEFVDEEGKKQIKVLTQQGIEVWPNLPGLKELADNWKAIKQ